MKVSMHSSSLKRARWYEHAIRFALGGAVTVAAGLVAQACGPSMGGLLLAFPAIFVAGVTLIDKHENRQVEPPPARGDRGRRAAAVDAAGATIGSVALLVFALIAWRLLGRWPSAIVL